MALEAQQELKSLLSAIDGYIEPSEITTNKCEGYRLLRRSS